MTDPTIYYRSNCFSPNLVADRYIKVRGADIIFCEVNAQKQTIREGLLPPGFPLDSELVKQARAREREAFGWVLMPKDWRPC